MGNAETIAHHRIGHRAAAAMGGSVADDVTHHQEIIRESFVGDDPELQIQPLLQLGRNRWIAPARSFECELPELIESSAVSAIRGGTVRCPIGIGVDAPLGNFFDAGTPRDSRESAGPRSGRAEPRPLRPDLVCGKGGEGGVERNRPEQPVATPFLRMRGHDSVGGDHWQPEPAGGGQVSCRWSARAAARRRDWRVHLGGGSARGTRDRETGESGLRDRLPLSQQFLEVPPCPLRVLLHRYVPPGFAGMVAPVNSRYCPAHAPQPRSSVASATTS